MKWNHKVIALLLLAIFIVLFMIAIEKNNMEKSQGDANNNGIKEKEREENFFNMPYEGLEYISKGLAIKMVALLDADKTTIQYRDREINFKDSSAKDWFDKYFNTAIIEGYYTGEQDLLKPLDYLKYKELDKIARYNEIDLLSYDIKVEGNEEEAVSYEEWIAFFEALRGKKAEDQIEEIDLYIFATPAISTDLKSWEIATDKGKFGFEGIVMDGCINKKISALVKENEIIAIQKIVEENPTLTSAYIIDMNEKENYADVFMGGVKRRVEIGEELRLKNEQGMIADIRIQENKLVYFEQKDKSTRGVVSSISRGEIEVKDIGKLYLSEDVKFYNVLDKPEFTNYAAVIVGYDTATLFLSEDKIVAAIILEKVKVDHIRVVLKTTGFRDFYHDEVQITSSQPFYLKRGKEIQSMEGNAIVEISKIPIEIGERIYIEPSREQKLRVDSIERGAGNSTFHPEYRGVIEVERTKEGYVLVNEVDFEEYLYSVIPSEMPTSYGLEAAKVQAICARSYAYNQILGNRFSNYGAHVDDSVSSQVYNNTKETSVAIEAANATRGQLLSYQGGIISTNFFSTSCGVTADSGDVWGDYITKEFPTASSPYMVSKYQGIEGEALQDLSKEENFEKFIKDKKYPAFEMDFPWYRWTTKMTTKQIESSINKMIQERYRVHPQQIKTLDKNDIFRSREIDGIGELIDLWVYSRGKSGIITEIVVEGTKGVFKISAEYNIRALISPTNHLQDGEKVVITKNDGSKSENMSLMPSAFYIMDKQYDAKGHLTEVTFLGGGYGHGTGMSQNGAKAMVDLGYSYEEILKHFYQGTQITSIQ